jgi:succinylglutamate desuccinylase
MKRVIGDLSSPVPGPTLLAVGGVHGNEPAGTVAAERVVGKLASVEAFKGRFLALRGNVPALEAGRRLIDHDLNRLWRGEAPAGSAESAEMLELRELISKAAGEARGRFHFLDLHTTSGPTMPFFWIIPRPGLRRWLDPFDMPAVFDPSDLDSGMLVAHAAREGHPALLAEGGQHSDPASVDHLEAVLWIALVQAGCLSPNASEYTRSREVLRLATGGEKGYFEVFASHRVRDTDDFRMRPGYRSFQSVETGEHLADDRNGEIRAPVSGRILMPLYQTHCDEGFSIVREKEWVE